MKCLICATIIENFVDGEPRICIEHWKCPKCNVETEYDDEDGNEAEGLIIDDVNYITCRKCEGIWTASAIEKAIMRKMDVVICPCCKGQGAVSSKKAKKYKE